MAKLAQQPVVVLCDNCREPFTVTTATLQAEIVLRTYQYAGSASGSYCSIACLVRRVAGKAWDVTQAAKGEK